MKFKQFWKNFISERDAITLLKTADRLSKEELLDIQKLIKEMQRLKKPATVIINHLQKYNDKLSEYYKAKRVFDTENKNLQTESVIDSASDLDIHKFEVILSPDACKLCRSKTQNGSKIFSEAEITKTEYGSRPPFHPNCYCVLIPH